MNFELETEKIITPKCLFESSASQSVETEINLPDYCSDIKRILKCFFLPGINSVQRAGDRISAEGEIVIRLIYVNDAEQIDCYEQSADLSRFVDVKNMPENACARVSPKIEYVNCRAVSQRRFTVSGSVGLNFRIYAESENVIPFAVREKTVEAKTEKFMSVCRAAVGEKTFEMSETVELKDSAAIGRVLTQDACAVLQSVKAVSGKLLLKGELVLKLLYLADSGERLTEHMRHVMPISQIIEIPSIAQDGTNSVRLSVQNLVVQPKSDSGGKSRLVEFAAKISAFVTGTGEKENSVITDCYCTEYELKPEYKSVDFLSLVHTLEKRQSVKTSAEISGYKISSVLDARISKTGCIVNVADGRLDGKGTAAVEILFTDSDGRIQFAERNIDFGFEDSMGAAFGKIVCDPIMTIENLSYNQGGGSTIELNFEAYILADVFSVTQRRALTAVEQDGENKKAACGCALTVCFCEKGERLWDIAKRYNTSIAGIKEENSISEDELSSDRMLMIPSA